jgi:hypothetical protein
MLPSFFKANTLGDAHGEADGRMNCFSKCPNKNNLRHKEWDKDTRQSDF